MRSASGLLARYDGFGSVVCCSHGLVHVQLGATTLTLTEAQYERFVAMLADSAANYEIQREPSLGLGIEATEPAGADMPQSDRLDARAC